MKTLIAPRATKSIDQEPAGTFRYVPLSHDVLGGGSAIEYASPALGNQVAVFQCVRLLSNTVSQLPFKLYRDLASGGRTEATDHLLYDMFHDAVNDAPMSMNMWLRIVMQDLLTWGNHYSEIVSDRYGLPRELRPMSPTRVEVKWGNDGRRVYTHVSAGGVRTEMRPGSVLHIQGQITNGLVGLSPIALLRRTLNLGDSAAQFAQAVFANGARPGTVVTHPKTLSEPAQQRLTAQMDALKGSAAANKTVLLEEGMTVTAVGFPPEDAQFLETQLDVRRLIYGAYGVPNHKVGDLERATFSNIEQQDIAYLKDSIDPWLKNIEAEVTLRVIKPVGDPVFGEFLRDGYARADMKARSESFAAMWQHGVLSPDEWRGKENLNPLPDGIGERYYTPVNYAPVMPAPAIVPESTETPSEDEDAAPVASEVAA